MTGLTILGMTKPPNTHSRPLGANFHNIVSCNNGKFYEKVVRVSYLRLFTLHLLASCLFDYLPTCLFYASANCKTNFVFPLPAGKRPLGLKGKMCAPREFENKLTSWKSNLETWRK